MRISDWSSDVCSSDLLRFCRRERAARRLAFELGELVLVDGDVVIGGIGEAALAARHRPQQRCRRRGRQRAGNDPEDHKMPSLPPPDCPAWRSIWLCRSASASSTRGLRPEEHTSRLPSLKRNSYAVLCFRKKSNK